MTKCPHDAASPRSAPAASSQETNRPSFSRDSRENPLISTVTGELSLSTDRRHINGEYTSLSSEELVSLLHEDTELLIRARLNLNVEIVSLLSNSGKLSLSAAVQNFAYGSKSMDIHLLPQN